VTVDVKSVTDSGWAVSGSITISNPNPDRAAKITNVVDVLTGAINATVDCSGATEVAAGETLVCTYSADLPNDDGRTNTATATMQNYDFHHTDAPVASGTTDYSGNADVTFGDPANVTDECVDVDDDLYGDLGTVCAGDAPETFNYTLEFGPFNESCTEQTFTNTATFITNDTGATGSDSETVTVIVECDEFQGCTPGYWRTHHAQWAPTGYSPSDLVSSVFNNANPYHNRTLGEAIAFAGGPGVNGAKQILLRAAVASLLNASHPDINFTMSEAEVIAAVNAALTSNNRNTMLTLAAQLDDDNNLGCSIDAHGNVIVED